MKVRANAKYTFNPAGLDTWNPPYGVLNGTLKPGDTVVVVKLRGCPPPNTMRMAHINTLAGDFAGLVLTASLERAA